MKGKKKESSFLEQILDLENGRHLWLRRGGGLDRRSGTPFDSSFFSKRDGKKGLDSTSGAGTINDTQKNEFMARFGIGKKIRRNVDMVRAINNPEGTVNAVNQAYYELTGTLTLAYRRVYGQLIAMNYSKEEAQARADAYIIPILQAEMKLMKARFPYTFGKKKEGKLGKQLMKHSEKHRESVIGRQTADDVL